MQGIHRWPVNSLQRVSNTENISIWWFPDPFVQGIHWSSGNSPHIGQWCRALMFSLICAWTNGWANNRVADDLSLYCAHYEVTVMIIDTIVHTLLDHQNSWYCTYRINMSSTATRKDFIYLYQYQEMIKKYIFFYVSKNNSIMTRVKLLMAEINRHHGYRLHRNTVLLEMSYDDNWGRVDGLKKLCQWIGRWIVLRIEVVEKSHVVFIYSLSLGECSSDHELTILKFILKNDILIISCEIDPKWMPQDHTNERATLVQVMGCWCQAAELLLPGNNPLPEPMLI